MKTKIVVGTRGSKLALIQTESVVSKLKLMHPELEISIKKWLPPETATASPILTA